MAQAFRKKPIVIEAMLFDGSYDSGVAISKWAHEGMSAQAGCIIRMDYGDNSISVRTLEGTMFAGKGDWIIKGIKGEFYPCKPEIFEATYEAVNT